MPPWRPPCFQGSPQPCLLAAQDPAQTREQTQSREQERIQDRDIYGWQLMTPQERDEYRARMRAAKSLEEREQIRNEHHKRMQERAKERGMRLLDEPPPRGRGSGMGPGGGMMGPGGGIGPGGGGMGGGRRNY